MAATDPKPRRGRPRLQGETAGVRVLVTLDEACLQRARELGDGNVSAGIRKSLQRKKTAPRG